MDSEGWHEDFEDESAEERVNMFLASEEAVEDEPPPRSEFGRYF